MTEKTTEDIELREAARALDAQYCHDYTEKLLERIDNKTIVMSDEKWNELADCLHKARCMLEHAYCRVIPKDK